MKKIFPILVLALFALWGCNDHNDFSDGQSGFLGGTVTVGPLCPVETPDCKPDPSLYLSHQLVILNQDRNSVVKLVAMDAQGNYLTELATGVYFVDFTPHDIGIPGVFDPPEARVEAGKTTRLDIHIDTGIR